MTAAFPVGLDSRSGRLYQVEMSFTTSPRQLDCDGRHDDEASDYRDGYRQRESHSESLLSSR